jgi:hypothetical protein
MPIDSGLLKQDLRKKLDGLKKLGAEVRDDLRTAGADARRQWKRFFEPQIANVEKLARDVGAASHDAVTRTSAAFSAFQASVKASRSRARTTAQETKPAKRKAAPRQARRRVTAKRAR